MHWEVAVGYITLILLLCQHQIGGQCSFSGFLLNSPKNTIWMSDHGLAHSIVRRFTFGVNQKTVADITPFHKAAFLYGWNQMYFDDEKPNKLQLMQICLDVSRSERNMSYGLSQSGTLLKSLTNWSQFVCQTKTRGLYHAYKGRSRNKQAISLLHINITCVHSWSFDHDKFLVRMEADSHSPIYLCLRFKLLNKLLPVQIFELEESEHTSFTADPNLCLRESLYKRTITWLRYTETVQRTQTEKCPLNGGFQIRRTLDFLSKQAICDSQFYGSVESECLVGEGNEWSFLELKCNPFAHEYVSRFACYTWWKSEGLQFVALYRRINKHVIQVYRLIYESLPKELDPTAKKYDASTKVWLVSGLQLLPKVKNVLLKMDAVEPQFSDHDISASVSAGYDKTHFKIFQVELRRAFGKCEDERETCDQGCSFSAQTQFFCHRSCLQAGKYCEVSLRDSCKFRQQYHGTWNLIELVTRDRMQQNSGIELRKLNLLIHEHRLILNASSQQANLIVFQCVRELRDGENDRYILRQSSQPNGCRIRDMCIEMSQGYRSYMTSDAGGSSIFYRMSHSHKQDTPVSKLCDFSSLESSSGHVFQTDQTKVLIRDLSTQELTGSLQGGVKCGIYQVQLKGVLKYLTERYFPTRSKPVQKTYLSRINITDFMQPRIPGGYNSTAGRFMQKRFFRYTPGPDCFLELTDFNSLLGTTGEFDNILRITSHCEQYMPSFLNNTEHTCLSSHRFNSIANPLVSYTMIITYSKLLEEYYCWLLRTDNHGMETLITCVIFRTPQCEYNRSPFKELELDFTKAIAILILTPYRKRCFDCKNSKSTENDNRSVPLVPPNVVSRIHSSSPEVGKNVGFTRPLQTQALRLSAGQFRRLENTAAHHPTIVVLFISCVLAMSTS